MSHEDVKYVMYGFASIKSHFLRLTESNLLLNTIPLTHNPLMSATEWGMLYNYYQTSHVEHRSIGVNYANGCVQYNMTVRASQVTVVWNNDFNLRVKNNSLCVTTDI